MAFAEEEAGEGYKHEGLSPTVGILLVEKAICRNSEPDWLPLAVPREHLARAAGHAVHQRK